MTVEEGSIESIAERDVRLVPVGGGHYSRHTRLLRAPVLYGESEEPSCYEWWGPWGGTVRATEESYECEGGTRGVG
jgi:hypothetical protein